MRERGFRRSLLIAALATNLARSATSPPQHALDERPAEATTPAARVREPPHARRCWDDTLEGSFLQPGAGARPAERARVAPSASRSNSVAKASERPTRLTAPELASM